MKTFVTTELFLVNKNVTANEWDNLINTIAKLSNSYNVVCSSKINNCMFIQDCSNLYECIFCAHISSKRFCIGNMQYEEEEYYQIKEAIVDWILSN